MYIHSNVLGWARSFQVEFAKALGFDSWKKYWGELETYAGRKRVRERIAKL